MSGTLLTAVFATVIVLNGARGVPAAATRFVRALIPLVRVVRALRTEIRGDTTHAFTGTALGVNEAVDDERGGER
ncbi:hypothetical protein [Lentzea sp. CA-135723]|uniref:hypothetical protein n=1 Tax=Lentzea sp. CA-135723 TaxID=3239950 RepID=UPI003D8BB78A